MFGSIDNTKQRRLHAKCIKIAQHIKRQFSDTWGAELRLYLDVLLNFAADVTCKLSSKSKHIILINFVLIFAFIFLFPYNAFSGPCEDELITCSRLSQKIPKIYYRKLYLYTNYNIERHNFFEFKSKICYV